MYLLWAINGLARAQPKRHASAFPRRQQQQQQRTSNLAMFPNNFSHPPRSGRRVEIAAVMGNAFPANGERERKYGELTQDPMCY
jgi:hypothetical protein